MADNFAFYLKYRPQSLEQLIGQESVKKTLSSSFQNNRLSHAYLFVGPRGTGKTSTARILAKMVNCESKDGTPCNKCSICTSITDGSNLDLIEIDAASNRGIEDIRSLRDKIKLAPTNARKKVYIIDEVHMLTTEAFNALLKTLEEPPAHALFILATTEIAKMPATILSRVQRLDFKLAKPDEISQALLSIIEKEKIDIDPEALKILVRRADGSFRDGVKLLDQVNVYKGKITAKSLEENLKIQQFDEILDLLKSFSGKDSTKGLLNISKQVENGADIKELTLASMDTLRSLVFIKNGLGENLVKQQFTEDKYEELVKLAESFTNQDLVKSLKFLQEALEQLKFTSIPALPLELAVVEICAGNQESKIQNKQLEEEAAKFEPAKAIDEVERTTESLIQVIPGAKQIHSECTGDASGALQSGELASNIEQVANDDILKLKERWNFVLETVRAINFSLEALLRSVNIRECSQTSIVMEVPYAFHQRILEAPKNRELLEGVFSDILGRNMRISTVLGNRPQRREDIANIEIAQDDEIIRAAAEIFNSDSIN